MDEEQWVCAKCGFTNEYYAAYCVSCSEIRPASPAEPPAVEKVAPRAGRQWDYTPPSAMHKPPASTTVGLPPSSPAGLPPSTSSDRRPFGLPRNRGKIRPLLILAIIFAVAFPAIRSAVDNVSTTATAVQWEDTYPSAGESGSPADIDPARAELLIAYQTKWQAWLEQGQGEFPGVDYLVIDELLVFPGADSRRERPGRRGREGSLLDVDHVALASDAGGDGACGGAEPGEPRRPDPGVGG